MRIAACFALMLCLTVCAGAEERKPPLPVDFRIGEREPGEDLTEMTVSGSDQKVYLHKAVLFSNKDIGFARAQKTKTGNEIEVTFTDTGKEKFAEITKDNIGKLLGIVVDGKLISAPRIMTAIKGGKAIITGQFSLEEVERIADGIVGK